VKQVLHVPHGSCSHLSAYRERNLMSGTLYSRRPFLLLCVFYVRTDLHCRTECTDSRTDRNKRVCNGTQIGAAPGPCSMNFIRPDLGVIFRVKPIIFAHCFVASQTCRVSTPLKNKHMYICVYDRFNRGDFPGRSGGLVGVMDAGW